MNLSESMKKYAELVIRAGVNLQKDQIVVIRSQIDCAPFVRLLAKCAYRCGAKDVAVLWSDEQLARIKYDACPAEAFETMPEWQALFQNGYAKQDACFISIASNDPEIFAGVEPAKIVAASRASHTACKPFYDRLDRGELVWNVISVPTTAWAKKVFPNCGEDEAVEKLWDAILKAVRVDTPDPIAAWAEHKKSFEEKSRFLNEKQFCSLHYTNSLGTDLTIGLTEHHIWQGGGDATVTGRPFFPNMPTEEVFSALDKDKVDGVVYSSMPLNYNGSLITNFSFTFKDGKIVSHTAEQGYEVLEHILNTDEGSRRLGEVALVPYHSPISMMNILFYNTLFDENASCHLALGAAYQSCVEGGLTMSKEDLGKIGLNDSINHIDFMVGTADLTITAKDKNGQETVLFRGGDWAI